MLIPENFLILLVIVVVCVFSLFGFTGLKILLLVLVGASNLHELECSFYYLLYCCLCREVFVRSCFIMKYLDFQNILIFLSRVIENLLGLSSLGWNLWSLSDCETSFPAFLTFAVSSENLGAILMVCFYIFFLPLFLWSS